jgi:hypothetical protein
MKRTAIAAALTCLALAAPAAHAKGPHAYVEIGPEGLRPGQPWVTTLNLVEFSGGDVGAAQPVVVLRSGDSRFSVRPALIDSYVPPNREVLAEARYRLRAVFPRAGRWTYTLLDGTKANRRFRFPAATIGNGATRDRTGQVAFPEGSQEERAGGGGPVLTGPEQAPAGDALPPEVIVAPRDDGGDSDSDSDDGGVSPWVPAVGLALAGVVVVGWRRRH